MSAELPGILGGLVAAIVILVVSLMGKSKKIGAAETQIAAQKTVDVASVKKADDTVKAVEKQNEIETRLTTDSEYSRRVRDAFSRD